MKAVDRLINAVWTLEYNEVSENEIEIVRYSRNDEEGYTNEFKLPKGRVVEDDNRTVIGALIDGKHYKVTNPKHVFSYNL